MTRGMWVAAGLVFLGLIGTLIAADVKPKTIKEVMADHKKDELRQQIGADLKEASPDWAAIQKETKKYAADTKELVNFVPPKGDEEDYKKLAKAFSDAVADIDKAAQEKDDKAAMDAFKKSGTYCMTCHEAHRPK